MTKMYYKAPDSDSNTWRKMLHVMLKVQIFQTEKLIPSQKSSESKFQTSQIFMRIIQNSKIRRAKQGDPIALRTQIDLSGRGRMGRGSV